MCLCFIALAASTTLPRLASPRLASPCCPQVLFTPLFPTCPQDVAASAEKRRAAFARQAAQARAEVEAVMADAEARLRAARSGAGRAPELARMLSAMMASG